MQNVERALFYGDSGKGLFFQWEQDGGYFFE